MNKIAAAYDLYGQAREFTSAAGYGWEVEWLRTASIVDLTESDLLREAAWVILCSGFRESVVRKKFNYISLCFCDWESAQDIVDNAPACRSTALVSFQNTRKIDAIIQVSNHVIEEGFPDLKKRIADDPITELRQLPYIGPITSWHLAKNLGFQVAKPDRHLNRFSELLGFRDAHHLCKVISDAFGDPVSIVDVVLWRYAANGGFVSE